MSSTSSFDDSLPDIHTYSSATPLDLTEFDPPQAAAAVDVDNTSIPADGDNTNDDEQMMTTLATHRLRPIRQFDLWSLVFDAPLTSSSAALIVSDLLLLVFSFLSADLSTLLGVSSVSRGWRERADCLSQWQTVFIAQWPEKQRKGQRYVNSRRSFVSTRQLIYRRKTEAAVSREAAAWIPLKHEVLSKLFVFLVFGSLCSALTLFAYWLGADAGGLTNDVSLGCAYFFTSLSLLLLTTSCLARDDDWSDDDDDDSSSWKRYLAFVFESSRSRHAAKTLFILTYIIVLVLGTVVALMSIRLKRLEEWRALHPSWQGDDSVLYSSWRSDDDVVNNTRRWLPAAVVFQQPELFGWESEQPISIGDANISSSTFFVMMLALNSSRFPTSAIPPGATGQRYAVLVSAWSNASNTAWPPPSAARRPLVFRTPFEAVGYFNLDPLAQMHKYWYIAAALNYSGRIPPLLVALGPTPESLYDDYLGGLLALIYTDVGLFGVGVIMFFLGRCATRWIWRLTICLFIVTCNTILMAVWGGICYFSSKQQPPEYCLMSRTSALALLLSGVILTVVPQIVIRLLILCDD